MLPHNVVAKSFQQNSVPDSKDSVFKPGINC